MITAKAVLFAPSVQTVFALIAENVQTVLKYAPTAKNIVIAAVTYVQTAVFVKTAVMCTSAVFAMIITAMTVQSSVPDAELAVPVQICVLSAETIARNAPIYVRNAEAVTNV